MGVARRTESRTRVPWRGPGEAVNELAMKGQFGRYQQRHDRLIEAIALIRQLRAD